MTSLVNWLVYSTEYDCQIFSKYLVFQIQGVKNPAFQHFWFEIPSISSEILGFSFEILGISKMCECRNPWYADFYKVRSFYDISNCNFEWAMNRYIKLFSLHLSSKFAKKNTLQNYNILGETFLHLAQHERNWFKNRAISKCFLHWYFLIFRFSIPK